jgi:hypothetical protein
LATSYGLKKPSSGQYLQKLTNAGACSINCQILIIMKANNKCDRTIILSVVLYGCETWSLTLRDERRLRVFENRVLRRVFGPKRDEVTGEWRKLHNEDLSDCTPYPILCWC